LGLNAVVVQRAQHLEAGQHAVVAVELAAVGLGVDVAAHRHRGGVDAAVAVGADRVDVADAVHAQCAAGLAQPAADQGAALTVQVGEREPGDAALGCGADPGQFHQAVPEAVAVDREAGRGFRGGGAEVHVDACGWDAGVRALAAGRRVGCHDAAETGRRESERVPDAGLGPGASPCGAAPSRRDTSAASAVIAATTSASRSGVVEALIRLTATAATASLRPAANTGAPKQCMPSAVSSSSTA